MLVFLLHVFKSSTKDRCEITLTLLLGEPTLYSGSFWSRYDSDLTLSINNMKDKQSPCRRPVRYFMLSVVNVSFVPCSEIFVDHIFVKRLIAEIRFGGTLASSSAFIIQLWGTESNTFL